MGGCVRVLAVGPFNVTDEVDEPQHDDAGTKEPDGLSVTLHDILSQRKRHEEVTNNPVHDSFELEVAGVRVIMVSMIRGGRVAMLAARPAASGLDA